MPTPARFPFLKAMEAAPVSRAGFKARLDGTLTAHEKLVAELARKDAEIRELRARLAEMERALAALADQAEAARNVLDFESPHAGPNFETAIERAE